MALETGTYISDLVSTNPVGTDFLDKADDHIRLIKSTVKATFPNISGAVTATHTELNALDGMISQTGSGFLRNRIINGDMRIDQRNAGAAVSTDNAFTVDRFGQRQSGGGVLSFQQSSTAPTGFTNSLAVTVTTADASIASTDNYHLFHRIEGTNTADLGFGSASAQTVTLSFWIRSSVTGTFGGCLQNSAADRSYVFQYTISAANTWEYKTVTVSGDTSGTWLTTTGQGIGVIFDLGCGSSYNGTASAWNAANSRRISGNVQLVSTLSATWYITGVQLEAGSTATAFERRQYGQELALCYRYYYRYAPASANGMAGAGLVYATSVVIGIVPFPVTMRSSPTTLEQSGTASHYNVYVPGGTTVCTSVPTFNTADQFNATVLFTTAATLTAGQASIARFASTSAYLGWSAEL